MTRRAQTVVLDPATRALATWLNGCDAADVEQPEFPHHFYVYKGTEVFPQVGPINYY